MVVHIIEGPIKDYLGIEREEKAHHPAGIKPTTSLFQGMHTTAVQQPLPKVNLKSGKLDCTSPMIGIALYK